MDTDDVLVFITAVNGGSLSEAARRLGISPMLASRRLGSLESALGVRLLQRTTRSLSLTPEGQTLLPFAKALVENDEEARAALRTESRGAAGLLRVSVPVAFGAKVVAPLVPALLRENPEFRISIDMNDGLPDLVSSGTDLAIRIGRLKDSSLIAQKLAENPRSLVAAPSYLRDRKKPVQIADLAQHECLPLGSTTHWTFHAAGGDEHVRLLSRFSSSSIVGCHAACLAGGGVALLSDWNVDEDVQAGRLIRLALEDGTPEEIAIWAVYPTTRLVLPKVRVFLSALRRALNG
ncbi:LysR family transcriptional regulator [Tardiphaga alba]|uniref:LysR family transcriptional regulator n=1 Tax=Tardiphaga alba TaxID=340268 RepID=A0ABX8A4W7_9BRAD|nr:LysR family transcriptional regulator [Tardiphaga alba]QUS38066.1 LysR family transcriptional regulator [Tardiphaga alba]